MRERRDGGGGGGSRKARMKSAVRGTMQPISEMHSSR